MSLFVAIRPPESAREDLQDAIDRVRKPLEPVKLHWQPADRWHVTVAFLGEQDDEADDRAAACIDAVAASTDPLTLRLGGAGSFGRQVLWVGIQGLDEGAGAGFTALAGAIQSGLRNRGFSLEKRPWHPHLTVARTRGTDARAAVDYLTGYVGPRWVLPDLVVIRSDGGPNPRHTVVHSAPITPSGDHPSGDDPGA